MAVITTYHCPGCRVEIKGLGWNKGKMDRCPKCGIYIRDLNKKHLQEFTKWIVLSIIATLCFVVVPVISLGFLVLTVILFIRRKASK
jgi:hypothetical protein